MAPRCRIRTAGSRTTTRRRPPRGSRPQNKVTFPYLERIAYRKHFQRRVKQLNDYAKYSAPSRKGPYFFFSKNEGLQNQSVLFIQKGFDGPPEVLLDPNTWSEDGTVGLAAFAPSKDAKYAVYGISRSGSDWQEYRVMELATRKTLQRQDRVGQGFGRSLAGRWLLLQPLSRTGTREGKGLDQREPPGVFPPRRHPAIGGRHGLPRSREPAAIPHRRDDG